MQPHLVLACLILIIPICLASAESGTVDLNDYTFNKIIDKFTATLVKFDVAFPFGDKHDAFVALAKEAKDLDDLLFAEVGIKDYGEKENEELATKYGATKENLPVVKLFLKGETEPITFDDKEGFTSDNLRRFVRDSSGMYLSLPGCIRQLDVLAIKFNNSPKDEKEKLFKESKNVIKTLKDKDADTGKLYTTIMQKVMEKDNSFVTNEIIRVNKLLTGKVSNEKKKELALRINILQSFTFSSSPLKDEL